MKKLFSALLVLLAFNAIAADWTIIRSSGEVRIYQTTISSNGTTWLSVYPLTNPTVDMLENVGLPKNLWGQVVGADGIYSSQLDECNNQLMLAKQLSDNDEEYINELEEQKKTFMVLFIFMAVIACLVIFLMGMNMRRTKR